jgi:hypothetical protein
MPPTQRCAECRMPVNTTADPEGTVAINRDVTGRWVGRVLKADEQPDPWERRHITHFATCKVLLVRREREAAAKRAGAAATQAPGVAVTAATSVVSLDAYRERIPHAPRHGRG